MFTGLYASAAGMLAQMKNLDVLSNNIANINTSGYKKDKSIFRSFYDDSINSLSTPLTSTGANINNKDSNSLPIIEKTAIDFSDGVIKNTGNTLDIAIQGDGFFELQGSNGETYYTRTGNFTLNRALEVVDSQGFKLMGEIGVIKIPEGVEGALSANLTIDESGNVSFGEEISIDKISIFRFDDNSKLYKIGKNLFVNSGTANVSDDLFEGKIYQGHLEMSNVNPVAEMAEMITTSRAFEAYQRVIRAIMDDMSEKSINLIGRVR